MAAFVPHRSNKYFHVMASNGIVSSCLIYHRCISNRTGFGYSNCAPNVVGARSSVLNHHRFWGYTSGPSSSRNTLPSTIHGHAACRSALPRERFSPLAPFGSGVADARCPLIGVDRKWSEVALAEACALVVTREPAKQSGRLSWRSLSFQWEATAHPCGIARRESIALGRYLGSEVIQRGHHREHQR